MSEKLTHGVSFLKNSDIWVIVCFIYIIHIYKHPLFDFFSTRQDNIATLLPVPVIGGAGNRGRPVKAMQVSGGYAIKRRARVPHDCHDCWHIIEPGEDYYQLTLRGFYSEWITNLFVNGAGKGDS